ncbi:hypothetical protein C823_007179 [Eubacterium plexicaudatum ASF492]|nr:hypothetical protein C823_007179 [Eubacterium plexicaudatum ASF492]
MYFELLFIISAGISLFHSEFLNNKTANVRKTHMAVLILSPVFFILCSRRLFTIREMLSGCAFAFLSVKECICVCQNVIYPFPNILDMVSKSCLPYFYTYFC